jgi:hypothetical protein
MPAAPRRHAAAPSAALAVVVLHGVALLLLLRLGVWSDRLPALPPAPPLWLQWLPLLPEPAPPPADRAPPPPAPRAGPSRPPRPRPADALQAITPPAPEAAAIQAADPADPHTAPAPVAEPAAPPLNLALPRGASAPWRNRNPALDDPRSNTARLTLEQRIAESMGGDGVWVLERIDADHVRYRRGRTCIYLQRPRYAQLFPFDRAAQALPWQVSGETGCRD